MKPIMSLLITLSLTWGVFGSASRPQPNANASGFSRVKNFDGLSVDSLADLAKARRATAKYHRVEQAEADGYINLNFCEEGEGCHWLKPSLLDGEFDPSEPEILLYTPDKDGWRLVAVEYVVPLAMSAVAPAGFVGDADHWREDSEGVGLWELTVWLWLDNPNGLYEQHNPRA